MVQRPHRTRHLRHLLVVESACPETPCVAPTGSPPGQEEALLERMVTRLVIDVRDSGALAGEDG